MVCSKQVEDYMGRGWKESILKVGDKFTITHCDGYIANETIKRICFEGGQFYYVCESIACYNEEDLKNAN